MCFTSSVEADMDDFQKNLYDSTDPIEIRRHRICERARQIHRKEEKKRRERLFLQIAGIAAAFVIGVTVSSRIFSFDTVSGESMMPTLVDGETVFIVRNAEIARGDIVIADMPEGAIVKRVIGVPGDTIDIRFGRFYINDKPVVGEDLDKGDMEYPLYLGRDEYFCMGDNRKVSVDSRWKIVGLIKKENIYGKVIAAVGEDDKTITPIK